VKKYLLLVLLNVVYFGALFALLLLYEKRIISFHAGEFILYRSVFFYFPCYGAFGYIMTENIVKPNLVLLLFQSLFIGINAFIFNPTFAVIIISCLAIQTTLVSAAVSAIAKLIIIRIKAEAGENKKIRQYMMLILINIGFQAVVFLMTALNRKFFWGGSGAEIIQRIFGSSIYLFAPLYGIVSYLFTGKVIVPGIISTASYAATYIIYHIRYEIWAFYSISRLIYEKFDISMSYIKYTNIFYALSYVLVPALATLISALLTKLVIGRILQARKAKKHEPA